MLIETETVTDEHLQWCPVCRPAMVFNIIAAGPPQWLEEYFAAGGVRPGDISAIVDSSGARKC